MTSFPIFERLRVRGYGLYPGDREDGLDLEFDPGLTLVLGANGLGKTTLVTMLYRLCTGPFEIPGLSGSAELGNQRLEARSLNRTQRRLFAARVMDDAASASATLSLRLGQGEIKVTRSLSSLTLEALEIDGETASPNEDAYQQAILRHGGLSSFGDWILLLQHLTFYFETRRALVWDPSAQRQILRILLLPASTGTNWRERERAILERDSRMRNLQSALTREERSFAATTELATSVDEVRGELAALEKLQEVDQSKLSALSETVISEEAARQDARLSGVKAEAAHESAYRDLERQQLLVIAATFPDHDDTARYLLGKLFSEHRCLACGNDAREAVTNLETRQRTGRCVICDTPLSPPPGTRSLTSRSIGRATKALSDAAARLDAVTAERAVAETNFDVLLHELQALQTAVADRDARLEELLKRLPPGEAELHERHDELAALRRRVEILKAELADERAGFVRFIGGVNRTIARHKDPIQQMFGSFAEGFLLENCELAWAPHKDRLGESGQSINFPFFELELGGASFPSPVRRHGPQQVSESQREFIDLAFRMTLMQAVGDEPSGTLVIDAPESSLDAVFVKRAADVLTRFSTSGPSNRLLITSNLIEGDLIPELLRRNGITSAKDSRVVDLLKLAAPTAATRELASDYSRVRRDLFARAKSLAR